MIGKRISNRAYLTFARALGNSSSERDQVIVLEYDQNDRLGWVITQLGDGTLRSRLPGASQVLMRRLSITERRGLLVLLAIAVLCVPLELGAVCGQPVRRASVEDVQLLVEDKPTSDAAVLDLIEVRRGQALSARRRARIDRAHLQPRPLPGRPGRGGARRLGRRGASHSTSSPFTAIQRIEFTGTLGLSAGELRSTVADRYGASPPIGRVDAAVRTLQQLYADHGYLRAKSTPRRRFGTTPIARC